MSAGKNFDYRSPALQVSDYFFDAGQRTVLFWDTLRQRGNQYLEHMSRKIPHVLNYKYEIIVNGRDLSEPINYGLVKILPPEGMEIDDRKRPFVVVDRELY